MKFNGNIIQPLDKQSNKEKSSLLPKIPFTIQLIGQKSSGKSSTLLNMLLNEDMLCKKFHNIFFISPTAKLDEKINVLKENKILLINKPLIAAIKKNKKNHNKILDFEGIDPEFNEKMLEENFKDDVSIEFLKDIIEEQRQTIIKYGKKVANNILLIYDDAASEKKFFNSKIVTGMIFNSRHLNVSVIFSVQAYTAIPKSIRLNNSINIIYETYNKKELEFIYSENVSNYTFEEFNTLFKSVIEIPYKFFVINYQNCKEHRYQNCFENFVSLEDVS